MTGSLRRFSAGVAPKRGVEPRFDLRILLDRVDLSPNELATVIGRSRAHVYRRLKEGATWSEADEWAVTFGMLPWEVWPEWDDADPADWCVLADENENAQAQPSAIADDVARAA